MKTRNIPKRKKKSGDGKGSGERGGGEAREDVHQRGKGGRMDGWTDGNPSSHEGHTGRKRRGELFLRSTGLQTGKKSSRWDAVTHRHLSAGGGTAPMMEEKWKMLFSCSFLQENNRETRSFKKKIIKIIQIKVVINL